MIKGNQFTKVLLWPPYALCSTHAPHLTLHMHKYMHVNKQKQWYFSNIMDASSLCLVPLTHWRKVIKGRKVQYCWRLLCRKYYMFLSKKTIFSPWLALIKSKFCVYFVGSLTYLVNVMMNTHYIKLMAFKVLDQHQANKNRKRLFFS